MKKKVLAMVMTAALGITLLAGSIDAKSASDSTAAPDTAETAEAVGESAGEVKKIVCGTTTGYYPFVFSDESDNLTGYDIELITAVFDRLPQYELTFELNEWDAILTGLDSGLYQISTETIFYSEERAEKYNFSDPIFYDPVVAVTPADYKDVVTFKDIEGETIPARAGSIWALAVEKYNEEEGKDNPINVDYAESDFFQLFGKAEAGEEILLTDYGMAAGIQESNDFNVRVQTLDSDFLTNYMDSSYTYFMMSKYGEEAEQLKNDVNKALAEVMADGTAQSISEKYFGEDFTPVKYPPKK